MNTSLPHSGIRGSGETMCRQCQAPVERVETSQNEAGALAVDIYCHGRVWRGGFPASQIRQHGIEWAKAQLPALIDFDRCDMETKKS